MKVCTRCGQEKAWAAFRSDVRICADCMEVAEARRGVRLQKVPKTAPPRPPAASAAVEEAPDIVIAHRQTGAVMAQYALKNLPSASLAGAAFAGAALGRLPLGRANLRGADLHLADLTGSDLGSADLRGADLRGADLRGTDLREAKLGRANLNGALYDSHTRWPSGFLAETFGAVWTDR